MRIVPTKEEIDTIIEWCEERKKEKARIYVVERNPFKEKINWTRRFPLIEIDRPKDIAGKTSLVYDSVMKELWQYLNGEWMRVEPSIDFRIE